MEKQSDREKRDLKEDEEKKKSDAADDGRRLSRGKGSVRIKKKNPHNWRWEIEKKNSFDCTVQRIFILSTVSTAALYIILV